MTKIVFDSTTRPYYAGVDNVVLYVGAAAGVPWNGVSSIVEDSPNVQSTGRYMDGKRYTITQSNEEFSFRITAFTYPTLFEQCMGVDDIYELQNSKPFGLSYRTGDHNLGQIHLVYNATVSGPDRGWDSIDDQVNLTMFEWSVQTKPFTSTVSAASSHLIIELAELNAGVKTALFNLLYGTSGTNPQLPTFDAVLNLFIASATFVVVNNGDGTWTATGSAAEIQMLDATTFQLSTGGVLPDDTESYYISSF